MTTQRAFDSGMLAGMLFAVAAQAGHWLITPMSHPNASALRWWGVVAQGVHCLGVALWLVVRQRGRQMGAVAG